MTTAFLIGRIIFALYWLNNASNHLLHSGNMLGYAASKGVKSPKIAIVGSGLMLLIGGLCMLFGFATNVGIILLILFLLGVSFKMHAYWKETDPMDRMSERVNFMKNMALVGALLMMLAIPTPWLYSVTW